MKTIPKPWTLAEAKNKLTQVVNLARDSGPQIITRRSDSFVVIEKDQFDQLTGNKPSFVEQILSIPKSEDPILFERSKDSGRDIIL